MSTTHDHLLDKYAELIIRAGLNIRKGQQLIMTAPLEAVELVRRITHHAYRAGASLVTTLYSDEQTALMRFRDGDADAFDAAPGWLFAGMAEVFKDGSAARLAIIGENPALLAAENPDNVARANRARSRAYKPVIEQITAFSTNWCVASAATPSHARNVFPDLPEEQALAALWHAIFKCTRADLPDPVAAWAAHNAALHARVKMLNAKRYAALKYKGPSTDFTLGSWTTTSGRAAPPWRGTASSAIPTSPPKKSSPCRTASASTASCARPSRSPIRVH